MNFINWINNFFDSRGFLPITKWIVIRGFFIATVSLLIGGLAIVFGEFEGRKKIFWFGASGMLAIWSFFSLASMIHQNIAKGWKNIAIKCFFSTQIRLFIIGFLVYTAFAYAKAPLIPMLIGLALPMLCVVISMCLPRG